MNHTSGITAMIALFCITSSNYCMKENRDPQITCYIENLTNLRKESGRIKRQCVTVENHEQYIEQLILHMNKSEAVLSSLTPLVPKMPPSQKFSVEIAAHCIIQNSKKSTNSIRSFSKQITDYNERRSPYTQRAQAIQNDYENLEYSLTELEKFISGKAPAPDSAPDSDPIEQFGFFIMDEDESVV